MVFIYNNSDNLVNVSPYSNYEVKLDCNQLVLYLIEADKTYTLRKFSHEEGKLAHKVMLEVAGLMASNVSPINVDSVIHTCFLRRDYR